MKVRLDNNGEMEFVGEIDLGPFGITDNLYMGYCKEFLDPEYDMYRFSPALKTLLPKGGSVEERLRMTEKVCEYAYRMLIPHLDKIYNQFWYEICHGWIDCEFPIWGEKSDGDYYEYIIIEKMPVTKGMTQEDLTNQIYGTSQNCIQFPFEEKNKSAGELFTAEIRRQMFPMVDFEYLVHTWGCSASMGGDRIKSITVHSDVADGSLFCAAMAELDEDYDIWSFHNF